LDRDQRVGDLAVPVQRGFLILGERLLEARLCGFEVATVSSCVVKRLEQSEASRPDASLSAEKRGEIAAHAAEKSGQADGWEEQCLGGADVGVGCHQQI